LPFQNNGLTPWSRSVDAWEAHKSRSDCSLRISIRILGSGR
jgi:hypothetical protein